MRAEADWYAEASPGAGSGHAQRKQGAARKLAVGLLLGASLMSGGLAMAGVPAPSAGIMSGTTTNAPAAISKLYGQLEGKVAGATPDTRLRVIVHLKEQADLSTWPASDRPGSIRKMQDVAARTQPGVISAMEAAGSVDIYERFWVFNGFAVEAPVSVLRELAQRDDVDYILEDGYMTKPKVEVAQPESPAINWNIYQVRAPETWALGYDGTGVVVANQDSGVEGEHDALETRWRGINGGTPANSWKDPYNDSPAFPIDSDGHGTHTMGTIAGYQGDATGGNEIGQAKGATWIACRIYDESGRGPFSYIHGCFQWMVDPDGDPNTNDQPATVNNSWGDSAAYQYPDLEWWPDIEAWRAVGIIPIFSNGNSGPATHTVGKPGAYPIVVGTGAIGQSRLIASFSSRGPAPNMDPWTNTAYWERSNWSLIKPDIVAPGGAIRSSLPGNSYGNLSGTSMASPHVAGLAGLLRQIRGDLTMNEFYNIMIETAYWQASFGTKPNNTYGWGEIDDYAAAIYVRDAGAILGNVTDAACEIGVPGAEMWVYAPCDDANANGECGIRKMITDNNGDYRTILAAGNYTVTISAPGYYGQVFNTSVMSATTNTLPIMLMKQPTGMVVGVVTSGGNPVPGASVSVDGLSNIHTLADASGNYTLTNVPAGSFTVRADACGYGTVMANVVVNYPGTVTQDLNMPAATTLLFDDFEDGDIAGWTVTGGSPTTGIWHNSDLRAWDSDRAIRAGQPAPPYTYTGSINTVISTTNPLDSSAADRVWLSFDLYDDAESEYDIIKVQISTDGGATWPETGANNGTVFGQASPVHGWQHICLDVTAWKSAQMKLRFKFTTSDSNNWMGEWFEGPTVDNVRLSTSAPAGTPLPAYTPTPGTPVPCQPVGSPTVGPSVTPTVCTLQFTDVEPGSTFYENIMCLACRGIINGYTTGCETGNPCFRPGNLVTRGQLAKIVANAAGFVEPVGSQQFEDVPVGSTFFEFVWRLADREIVTGYPCGGVGEPCGDPALPYFRPNNNVTRGQISKIVSEAAGLSQTPTGQQFQDVPEGSTFYVWIWRLVDEGVMNGYPCGGLGEPCGDPALPYFRPGANATRGQASKIVANTFFPECSPAR